MTNTTARRGLRGKVRWFHGWQLRPGRSALAIAISALLVAGCAATGTPAGAPGESASPTASTTPSLSTDAPEAAGSASGLMPGPSSQPGAVLETATAGPNPTVGASGSSGKAANTVIVCIGQEQGLPCVRSDQVLIVVAAEGALSSEARPLIGTATVRLTASCPAGAPAAACGTSDAPVATVRFDRMGGGLLGTVYVYRSTTGGLQAALLP